MIFCQMVLNSPNNRERCALNDNSKRLLHMTAQQISQARIQNDDIVYSKLPLAKIIILAQVLRIDRETSQRGMPVISIRLQDSTGHCTVKMYEADSVLRICQKAGTYVKIGATIKCAGLVYRPEIRVMGSSIAAVQDFNEVTQHFLECMKTALLAEV